jgi:hypothetical protein
MSMLDVIIILLLVIALVVPIFRVVSGWRV